MKIELAEEIVKVYRKLFTNGDPTRPIVQFGIECNDGWYEIIKNAIERIARICEMNDVPCKIVQIKEKYGTLRIYLDSFTTEIHEIIEDAERKSATVCETCGKAGKLRRLNWVVTSCDQCL